MKPDWKKQYDVLKAELDSLLRRTDMYVGKEESSGLFDLYVKIGKKAEAITQLINDNIHLP